MKIHGNFMENCRFFQGSLMEKLKPILKEIVLEPFSWGENPTINNVLPYV